MCDRAYEILTFLGFGVHDLIQRFVHRVGLSPLDYQVVSEFA